MVKKHDKYIYVTQKNHSQSDVFYVREMKIMSALWEKNLEYCNIVKLSLGQEAGSGREREELLSF